MKNLKFKISSLLVLLLLVSCSKTEEEIAQALNDPNTPFPVEEVTPTPPISNDDTPDDGSSNEDPATPVNLVINGSFEEGHELEEGQWGLFDSIPGWEADLNEVDAPIEIQNGLNIGGISAHDGKAILELDSHNRSPYTKSDARVFQEIDSSEIGKFYKITLHYTPRTPNKLQSSMVDVYWDDKKIALLKCKNIGWVKYEFVVEGTSQLTRLEFRAHKDKDTLGGLIDNVSMFEVE